ncbi:hypothetical protein KCM76_23285 [Zooshikella marina]|uniref:hypothetical protein n=1 Tax=Zooshikella ganghwensis TaxID=202772 RepID=UPI001BAF74D5|nr:hypothetical protein [Zooshikella ganghwensis]MBU2708938.1 hypothetical protein [Zooshikella ganghwensis]
MSTEFIVMVKVHGVYSFYMCDEPDLWVIDNATYAQAFIDAGFDLSYVSDDCERADTGVLSVSNIDKFLNKIASQKVDTSFLNELIESYMPTGDWWQIAPFMPQVIYDFDSNRYCSYHEQHIFDKFIPDEWSSDGDLLKSTPDESRYWVVNDCDLLEKE